MSHSRGRTERDSSRDRERNRSRSHGRRHDAYSYEGGRHSDYSDRGRASEKEYPPSSALQDGDGWGRVGRGHSDTYREAEERVRRGNREKFSERDRDYKRHSKSMRINHSSSGDREREGSRGRYKDRIVDRNGEESHNGKGQSSDRAARSPSMNGHQFDRTPPRQEKMNMHTGEYITTPASMNSDPPPPPPPPPPRSPPPPSAPLPPSTGGGDEVVDGDVYDPEADTLDSHEQGSSHSVYVTSSSVSSFDRVRVELTQPGSNNGEVPPFRVSAAPLKGNEVSERPPPVLLPAGHGNDRVGWVDPSAREAMAPMQEYPPQQHPPPFFPSQWHQMGNQYSHDGQAPHGAQVHHYHHQHSSHQTEYLQPMQPPSSSSSSSHFPAEQQGYNGQYLYENNIHNSGSHSFASTALSSSSTSSSSYIYAGEDLGAFLFYLRMEVDCGQCKRRHLRHSCPYSSYCGRFNSPSGCMSSTCKKAHRCVNCDGAHSMCGTPRLCTAVALEGTFYNGETIFLKYLFLDMLLLQYLSASSSLCFFFYISVQDCSSIFIVFDVFLPVVDHCCHLSSIIASAFSYSPLPA